MRKILSCALLLLGAAAPPPAREVPPRDVAPRIDAILASRIPTHEANGTVLVFRNGVQIYRRDIGMADFARRIAIGRRTMFRLASISKTFTGAAAVVLRGEHKLNFQAPVADYLPDFGHGREIRVFHLLVHSSGLGDVPDPPAGRPYRSVAEAVASFSNASLAFPPGTKSQYSNAGFVLAARLVEIASGRSYDDFLKARFFLPLGMASAHDLPRGPVARDQARVYYPAGEGGGLVSAGDPDLSSVVGAGALTMTADDLMRWLEAVRTRRSFDLWSQEYPWGWGKRTYFGTNVLEQSGRNAGYSTSVVIVPDKQLSVLCLFNTQSGFGLRCAAAVAAAILDQQPPEPLYRVDLPRAALSRSGADALAGSYEGNGWTLRIARKPESLRYSWDGERWIPLTPSTGHRFLMVPDSAVITAVPKPDGGVDEIVYRDGLAEAHLSRARPESGGSAQRN